MAWHGLARRRQGLPDPGSPRSDYTGKREARFSISGCWTPSGLPRRACMSPAKHRQASACTATRGVAFTPNLWRVSIWPSPNVPCHFDPCLWQPAELALPLRATATRVKAMSVALVLPRYKSAASPCSSGSLFLSWLPCVQRADTINTRVWDLYDGEWIWVSSVICFGVVKITKIFRSSKNLTSHAASSLPIKRQSCLHGIHLSRGFGARFGEPLELH